MSNYKLDLAPNGWWNVYDGRKVIGGVNVWEDDDRGFSFEPTIFDDNEGETVIGSVSTLRQAVDEVAWYYETQVKIYPLRPKESFKVEEMY